MAVYLFRVLREIATRANDSLQLDGIEQMRQPLRLAPFATLDLPDATLWEGAIVYDTDDQVVKFSDGANWAAI